MVCALDSGVERISIRLEFTSFEVDTEGSLIWAFETLQGRSGVYWLGFTDGTAYIGQSVGLSSRLATHRRRWVGEISQVRIAVVPIEDLDEAERALITRLDRQGRSLRSQQLTRRPGGNQTLEVEVRAGASVRLPWKRAERAKLAPGQYPLPGATSPAHQHAYEQLRALPIYDGLCQALAAFVDAAIPDPARTVEVLWTMTALPSTNRTPGWRRLATANAGVLETLRIFEETLPNGEKVYPAFLNIDYGNPAQRRKINQVVDARQGRVHKTSSYRSDPHVLTIEISAGLIPELIRQPVVADRAYTLVVRHLRRGSNPQRKYHHRGLTRDVFTAVHSMR